MEFENNINERIEGRNAVIEALRAGRAIDKIYIAKGEVDQTLGHIASKARAQGVVVVETDRRKLDAMSQTHAHQGVVALCAVKEYCTVEDLLQRAAEKGEAPFLVMCDEISDPHNLGAIIRTAECVGAHGVIIPKRRSAGLTAVVDKASAGAAEHLPIARVPNLSAAIETLKKAGVWVYGAAAEGTSPRRGRRGRKPPVENRPHGQRLHRDRLGGRRHQPPRARALRRARVDSDEGRNFVPERQRGSRRADV